MRHYLLRFAIAFCIISFEVTAEEVQEEVPIGVLNQVLLMEGIIAANAGLAAHHPEGWGWAMTVISPLCAVTEGAGWQKLSGFSACLGMGQYNVKELSKEKYSSGAVFEKNFVLMNGLLATAIIGDQLLEYFDVPHELSFQPLNEAGLALSFNKDF